MALTRDEVFWAYRIVLGRAPESEQVINHYMQASSLEEFCNVLLSSDEFILSPRFKSKIAISHKEPNTARNHPHHATASLKIALLGNCQATDLAKYLQAMTGDILATSILTSMPVYEPVAQWEADVTAYVEQCDLVLTQPGFIEESFPFLVQLMQKKPEKFHLFPAISFLAFHPDMIYITSQKGEKNFVAGPLGHYQSEILLDSWKRGLTVEQAVASFCDENYAKRGYYDYWEASRHFLLARGREANLPLDDLLRQWERRGCFMHVLNHPKGYVIADLAEALLRRMGIQPLPVVEGTIPDALAFSVQWPIYPEVAKGLGLEGNYLFKGPTASPNPVLYWDLLQFAEASYKAFDQYDREALHSLRDAVFVESRHQLMAPDADRAPRDPDTASGSRATPYSGLPEQHFWKRAVTNKAIRDVDPVVRPAFIINKETKIATAGSCFAQHLSHALQRSGFNYYVTESGEGLDSEVASRRGYGVFSARFGNIYSPKQLLQLLDRAYGEFTPLDAAWLRSDGRWVDPFRPEIEPDGFESIEAVENARKAHLRSVRTLFSTLDVFVFTLGLTEAWRSKRDGAVFPLAPGVSATPEDAAAYEFINYSAADVTADLKLFLQKLSVVNPRARVLLTVSPVPLAATYTDQHVMAATSYSKSVLRCAADEIVRSHENCAYFPSYEIVSGHYNRGAYFGKDLRSVTRAGVDHVMRLFMKHYAGINPAADIKQSLLREMDAMARIVCEEEKISSQ